MKRGRRSWLIATLVATGLGLGATSLAPALAAPSVPANTISRIGMIPTRDSASIAMAADPVNNYLYEYDHFNCPNLMRLDADSYATVATDEVKTATGQCQSSASILPSVSGDPVPDVTFDAADKIAFYIDASTGGIGLLDEGTLRQLGTWAPPSGTGIAGTFYQPHVYYASWYPADDELLVTLWAANDPAPAMWVSALSVPLSLAAHRSVPLWTLQVPGCVKQLTADFATAAAYHAAHESAVYVPCVIEAATTGSARPGVVKVQLGSKAPTGTPCVAPAKECPTGATNMTVLPEAANDFIFDPGSDRAFMPERTDAIVYDGHEGVLEGRTAIGTPNDVNGVALGLNPTLGRVYAVSQGDGFMVIDGRRTPVSPGYKFLQYADRPRIQTFPVLYPDAANPYNRVIVPHSDGTPNNFTRGYLVYADTLPPGEDPPVNSVDVNTFNDTIPAGADVSKVYSGTARGFGFHNDYVGGISAQLTNLSGGSDPAPTLPFTSTTDLMAAAVQKLSYGNSSSEGDASALADPSGGTAYTYNQCTGATTAGACLSLPCPLPSCSVPAPQPSSSPPATNQQWPYPDAVCYQPGPAQEARGSVVGAYATDPTGNRVSDGNAGETAAVDCSGKNGSATGSALMQGSSTQDTGQTLPLVRVSQARVQSSVTDLSSAGQGIVSETTAEAHGIEIDVPGGPINIGSAVQHAKVTAAGKTGTAKVIDDTVTFSNITVAGHELCSSSCTQSDFDRLNNQFPAEFYAFRPAPDDRYNDPKTHMGSPGGYLAVVQANLPEQFGDQQFNAMSEEESTFLPALRIIVYGHAEGSPQINREVIDLAGVEADAEYGIQVIPPGSGGDYQPSNMVQVLQDAGLTEGPPTDNTSVTQSVPKPGSLLQQLVQRVLQGINWLLHSPGAAIEMALFLGVLLLPLLLMRRRWTWPGSTVEVIG